MNKTIIINRRTPVNLKDVAVIEAISPKDLTAMQGRYGGAGQDFAVFNSAVRFIDGSTKLAVQSLADFNKLTRGRMLPMAFEGMEGGKRITTQLVPIDAIRHLEPVSDDERDAMKRAYEGTNPEAIEAKRTRIVYRALDPANPQRYFRKTFAADIMDDLMDRDSGFLIDIGSGKFVLADEIEDAKHLDEKELARLSRKYSLKARNGDALITSIALTDGDFILSSLPAQVIETLVERPLPSLQVPAGSEPVREEPVSATEPEPAA